MILQTFLASTLEVLLVQTNLLLQILYTLQLEYVFLFDYSKMYLTNSMNTRILVPKLHIIHSLKFTTFQFLKNGFWPFLYMTVLNVNVINTSIKKFKLLLHNHFQNMLLPLIIAFLWTLKDLSIPLHTTNLIYMSSLTLSVTLLLQYLINQIPPKLRSKLFYTIGSLNLDHPYTLSLIVDQNMSTRKWQTFVHSWEFVILLEQLTYSPRTNVLVEVQNRNLGTHLRMFLYDAPKDWAFQVHM